jgi:hypothetical protein
MRFVWSVRDSRRSFPWGFPKEETWCSQPLRSSPLRLRLANGKSLRWLRQPPLRFILRQVCASPHISRLKRSEALVGREITLLCGHGGAMVAAVPKRGEHPCPIALSRKNLLHL